MEKNNFDSKESANWLDMGIEIFDFFTGNSISSWIRKYHNWKQEQIRKMMGLLLGVTGSLFLLIALAIAINEYVDQGEWIGYLAIGLTLFLIGLAMIKISSKN